MNSGVPASPRSLRDREAGAGPPPPPALNPYAAPGARSDRYSVASSLVEDHDAPLADRGSRLAAHFLDGIFSLLWLGPGMFFIIVGDKNEALTILGGLLALGGFIGLLIYQIRLLGSEGQTWGKKKMKVRIVLYDTGEIPSLGRTLGLRMFLNNLIGAIPCVGPIYSLVDILFIFGEERRCVHDFLAGTKVVEAG